MRRRSQVVKATVCKTVIPRFESWRRLHFLGAMKLPKFPEFRDLTLADKEILAPIFYAMKPEISDCNFTNLFMWQDFYQIKISEHRGNVCLFASANTTPEKEFFFAPLGKNEIAETIADFFVFLKDRGCVPIIRRASEQFVQENAKALEGFRVEKDPDISDYIYRAEDLIYLKGRRYHGQRNFIARFKKKYQYEIEEITPANTEECIAFCEDWLAKKIKRFDELNMPPEAYVFLKAEVAATNKVLRHWSKLDVRGMIVRIDGNIAGLSIGELLNPEMAVIHVEKCNHQYLGISQFICQEFCKRFWAFCKFINRMEDLGLETLRKAKMALGPHHMGFKYNITPL